MPEGLGKRLLLPLLEQVQLDAGAVELTDVRDTAQAIDAAIESIRSGENQILMKGAVSTGTLLKHALDRTRGLNIGRLASHLIVLQIPGLDRLLISTDGGLNIAPTLTEKADILRNAIDVARALGIETPKAACLAAVDYGYPWSQLLAQFKFQDDPGWATALAALMRQTPGAQELLEQADWVLPVPLALAQCAQKRTANIALTALSALAALGYLIAFALRWQVW